MQYLEVTMVVSFTSLVLITALLIMISTMPSRPGLGWWTTGAVIQSLTYLMAVFFFGEGTSSAENLVFFGMQTTVNYLVAIGTLMFIRKTVNLFYWTTVPFTIFMTVVGLKLGGVNFLADVVFSMLNATAFAVIAYVIFKSPDHHKSTRIMGLLSFFVAIHWLDYPFLSGNDALLSIGFALGVCLAVGMFLSLSAMALLQFRLNTKRSEERAIYAASHDSLTGLFNRSYLSELFDTYLHESNETGDSFLLLYLDLDGFKFVNDNHGHKAGDNILVALANRMETWLEDKGDAVRVGGDEIIVFLRLQGQFSSSSAYEYTNLLLRLIEEPVIDGENTYSISASIGGCYYQAYVNTPSPDEMMSCADKQMYRAKQAGGRCIFFPETYSANYSDSSEVLVAGLPAYPEKQFKQDSSRKVAESA